MELEHVVGSCTESETYRLIDLPKAKSAVTVEVAFEKVIGAVSAMATLTSFWF